MSLANKLSCGVLGIALLMLSSVTVLLATPGDLDTSFGVTNGRVTTSLGGFESIDRIASIATQSDGKIICVGSTYHNSDNSARSVIVRYAADGSLDGTFNSTGVLILSLSLAPNAYDWARAVAVQPDGKIVFAGDAFRGSSNSTDFYAVRLNEDGSFDSTFGTGGIVYTDFNHLTDHAYALAIQPDGKIILGGQSATPNSRYTFALTRYDANGTLDPSFGNGGKVNSGPATFNDLIRDIKLQPDGKIVAAGVTFSGSTNDFAVHRYDPDGSLDPTFDGDGVVTTPLGSNDFAASVNIQPDGKIIASGTSGITVAGWPHDVFASVRYNSDGSLDTTFDGDGKVYTNISSGAGTNDDCYDAVLQSDGKLLMIGRTNIANPYLFALIRYNPDGSLDTTFNNTGIVVTSAGSNSDGAFAGAQLADGKMIIAGETSGSTTTSNDFALIKYNADGSVDTSFGPRGIVTTTFQGVSDVANGVVVQPDGKLIAVGRSRNSIPSDYFGIARYESDGQLDTTFNGDGKAVFSLGGSGQAEAYRAVVQNDGKIVVAGYAGAAPNYNFAAARLNPDGNLDTSFGSSGTAVLPIGSGQDIAYDIAIQNDGKILLAGLAANGTATNFALLRLNPNGSRDSSFGSNGVVLTALTNGEDVARVIKLQSDGKILLAGYTTPSGANSSVAVVRYNTNGSLDNTFGDSGKVITTVGSSTARAFGMVVQDDQKIVLAGFATVDTDQDLVVLRFNNNGTLDPTFAGDGIMTSNLTGSAESASDIVVQANGRIVIGGSSTIDSSGQAHSRVCLARYNFDGSADGSFGANGIVLTDYGNRIENIGDIALQSDGKIVAAGAIKVVSTDYFMMLRYDGDVVLTPTPTPTSTVTATGTPTITPTATGTPTDTPTATPTASQSGPSAFDYDGDRKTDISVFRQSEGAWYLAQSQVGVFGAQFGVATDKITPADFDGDGKTDIAVYRPSDGIWYVLNSSDGTVSYYVFGLSDDLPTPADYDGDGKADVSVFRASTGTWYRQNSGNGTFFGIQFGASEDKPIVGDFDGDGKSDVAVFRPSTGAWYQVYSLDGSIHGENFGFGTDVLVPADYDGDGKVDVAVFRPSDGYWYARNSSDGAFTYKIFGLANDIPAPGDFDGDGKADINVFRPSDGTWYRQNSSNGAFVATPFGTAGDKPTMTAFRY